MSLVAAVLYAAASVFQHRAAVEAPRERSMRPGLLAHLVGQPWWVAGIVADVGGFGAQFVALDHGPLVLVQPLLVSGLLFALPLSALVTAGRVRAQELSGAAAVVAGLAALLIAANPERGQDAVRLGAWLALLALTTVPVVALVVVAQGRSTVRPAALAAAGGILYGLTAALTKAVGHALGIGVVHVLGSWQLYALIVAGAVGMLVTQSAFQAGPLRASLPMLTVVDPVVSILIGVTVFHEHIDQTPWKVLVEVAASAVLVAGVVVLGRSPLIAPQEGPPVAGEMERSARGGHPS
jgi:drug/metabolite transporter (DMT)-like permease